MGKLTRWQIDVVLGEPFASQWHLDMHQRNYAFRFVVIHRDIE